MRYFNLFYVAVLVVGISIYGMLRPNSNRQLSFYGFAESNETEINYNYAVVVDDILVSEGQSVRAGDVLMHLSRRKAKESLEDQLYKISELQAEEAIWRQKKESDIAELLADRTGEEAEWTAKILEKEKELSFKKSLSRDLTSINPQESSYNPLEEEIKRLKSEKQNALYSYDIKLDGLRKELSIGDSPYKAQIRRLSAELAFEETQKVQEITVTAPTDGLIGNISCKEEEHIPSYTTLLSFYEPRTGIIKGYVHEDMTLEVQIGDHCEVSSLKDATIIFDGQVVGLGSRIVEIPARLRKIPELKSYGREMIVEIDINNSFLQKEKVSIDFSVKS